MVYEIIRENNKYNKYMKWHLLGKSEYGTHSQWFKTEKEAIYTKNLYESGVNKKYTLNNYNSIE